MLTLCIVCSKDDIKIDRKYDGYVGVDRGALILAKQHRVMEMAIGDFDSISAKELEVVKQFSKTIESLNPIKNESDLEATLKIWASKATTIHVYGALNGRLDHQYVNMQLMKKYHNVHLLNQQNHLMVLDDDAKVMADGFQYFSIFALKESIVSIRNAKYEISNVTLTVNDIYTLSNEFIDDMTNIDIHRGEVILIKSKDK